MPIGFQGRCVHVSLVGLPRCWRCRFSLDLELDHLDNYRSIASTSGPGCGGRLDKRSPSCGPIRPGHLAGEYSASTRNRVRSSAADSHRKIQDRRTERQAICAGLPRIGRTSTLSVPRADRGPRGSDAMRRLAQVRSTLRRPSASTFGERSSLCGRPCRSSATAGRLS